MSATLIDHQPPSNLLPHLHSFNLHHNKSYHSSPEERQAAQLAYLASQHHTSEYNRIKFGPKGCPVHYIPLSIHVPDQYKDLRLRQINSSHIQSWWLSQNQVITAQRSVLLGPCAPSPPTIGALDLQQQIVDAMTAPLVNTNQFQLKTSSSHPINISSIIAPELSPLISSHLFIPSQSSRSILPTVFEVPTAFTLDRLTQSYRSSHWRFPLPQAPSSTRQVFVNHLRTRSDVSEALQAAISSGIALRGQELILQHSPQNNSPTLPQHHQLPTFHPNVSSLSVPLHSPSLSPSPLLSLPLELQTSSLDLGNAPDLLDFPNQTLPYHPDKSVAELNPPSPVPTEASWDNISLLQTPPTGRPQQLSNTPSPPRPPPFVLGNLFLSSCPGKKVRLQGPVKGRSGVCRDLATDLRRMKDIGVACIVCCLDDNELDFLGAPWEEYREAAHLIGIDVLRIPTPEGLAPLTPATLDMHLVDLINTYTLQGLHILVHCRGGVGRAGIVACCWILKLGLCGWVHQNHNAMGMGMPNVANQRNPITEQAMWGAPPSPPMFLNGVGNWFRQDTVELVERVIGLVRKRRSVKAVETYEQVRYLVDYVEYLRNSVPEELSTSNTQV